MKTIFRKKPITSVNLGSFKDIQGIGNDPIYKRYPSLMSIVSSHVDPAYHSFLAQPDFNPGTEELVWYVDQWDNEVPDRLCNLVGADKERYTQIYRKTLQAYRDAVDKMKLKSPLDASILDNVLKTVPEPDGGRLDDVFCYDNKVSVVCWGMVRNPNVYTPKGVITLVSPPQKFKVAFTDSLGWTETIVRNEGHVLTADDIPPFPQVEGKEYTGWRNNPVGAAVLSNMVFDANVRVVQQPKPVVEPEPVVEKEPEPAPIPEPAPVPAPKRIPWYKRFWLWLKGLPWKKFLKWLLWLLLILLLLYLISLIPGCSDNSGCTDKSGCKSGNAYFSGKGAKPVSPSPDFKPRKVPDNVLIDDNASNGGTGFTGGNGVNGGIGGNGVNGGNTGGRVNPGPSAPIINAPHSNGGGTYTIDYGFVPPVTDANGVINVPRKHVPGQPDYISNRLNIYFDDDDIDLDMFYTDLKKVYPDVNVIGYDDNVKWIQIEVPESDRDRIREEVNRRLPQYDFFVVDELLFEHAASSSVQAPNGWHIDAVNLEKSWTITEGSPDIVVAVVDDGLDMSHPLFEGRIVKPYNVFTQSDRLDLGSGHGTHVAALAAGSNILVENGVTGAAPGCKLMPVQVFYGDICTFSSLANGIMYAIHNGADVVNVSICTSFEGLASLNIDSQIYMSENTYVNEAKVWSKIQRVADKKNVILVFAAGNDSVLASLPPEHRNTAPIVVSAVGPDGNLAFFSNFGDAADVSAPGIGIVSAWPGDQFKMEDGTSMASPIVAGIVALMRSVDPDITTNEVRDIFASTGRPVQGGGPLVDAYKAVSKAKHNGK